MMLLSLYIGELLFSNNCVIVPNFGAFLAKNRSAQISEDQKTIHPPFKEISFNQQVKNNDGLLASHLASKEGLSFDEACNRIASQVHMLKQELTTKRQCELLGLGTFRLGADTSLVFEASNKINYSRAAFGLQTVVLPLQIQREFVSLPQKSSQDVKELFSLTEKTQKEVATQFSLLKQEKSTQKIKQQSKKQSKVIYSAFQGSYKAIAASLVLSVGTWLTYAYLEHSFECKQVDLQVQAEQMVFEEIQKASFVFEVTSPLSLLSLDAPKKEEQNIITKASSKSPAKRVVLKKPLLTPKATPAFSIVAGAFRDRINADKMIAKLQKEGYQSEYIGKNRSGLHQVAYQRFSSKSEAIQNLRKIKASVNKSAWLLIKS